MPQINGVNQPQMHRPNILLIRLKCIGDVVFTLPAVHALKTALPDARISYVVSKEYAVLLEGFQPVDEVIRLNRRPWREGGITGVLRETLYLLKALRRNHFSFAFDFQGYGETALLARFSGAQQRWGPAGKASRQWAYTGVCPWDPRQHWADVHLAQLRAAGIAVGPARNHFVVPAAAMDEARRFLAEHALDSRRPMLFIQPFTSSPPKDWPLARFGELAAEWKRRGMQVLFGGGPAERPALAPIEQAGFTVAAGVPLLVAAGLTRLSTVVVGSNTGLLHLAVAAGARVVMLTDAPSLESCFPYQHVDWAVVPSAGRPVASLPVEVVSDACARAFRESSEGGLASRAESQ